MTVIQLICMSCNNSRKWHTLLKVGSDQFENKLYAKTTKKCNKCGAEHNICWKAIKGIS